MNFLVPLYIAAASAVVLPVIFHLIRRTPRGQIPFSTLLFLRPSPPRLTRRSRLDNWLLLVLRGLALVLIALAFARPFFRDFTALELQDLPGRRLAILIDTSASMQRPGIWPALLQRLDVILGQCERGDQLMVMSFDESVRTLLSFDEGQRLTLPQRTALIKRRVGDGAPTWHATRLDQALTEAAEALDTSTALTASSAPTGLQIMVLTDLQQGIQLAGLQAYNWPEAVRVDIHRIEASAPGNAGLHVLTQQPDQDGASAGDRLPVRIDNAADTPTAQFRLAWADDGADMGVPSDLQATSPGAVKPTGKEANDFAASYHIPPGESRVIRAPPPPQNRAVAQLVLTGDRSDFDNHWYVAVPPEETLTVIYVGRDDPSDTRSLRYYLERVFPDQPARHFRVVTRPVTEKLALDNPLDLPLVVVGSVVGAGQTRVLHEYLRRGGTVLLVLGQPLAAEADRLATETMLRDLLREPEMAVHEGTLEGQYIMLRDIDFKHRLFAPFVGPQYSDFTRIHFWRYRQIDLPSDSSLNILAAFENDAPFLVERVVAAGRLYVATSGWQAADSELALSSKFPPLMAALTSRHLDRTALTDRHYVGQSVRLPANPENERRVLQQPNGQTRVLASSVQQLTGTDVPGVYTVISPHRTYRFAVNVDPSESLTQPLDVSRLEELGVVLGNQPTRAELVQRRRVQHDIELEQHQQIWRWLLVIALAVILFETFLASQAGRRVRSTPEVAT